MKQVYLPLSDYLIMNKALFSQKDTLTIRMRINTDGILYYAEIADSLKTDKNFLKEMSRICQMEIAESYCATEFDIGAYLDSNSLIVFTKIQRTAPRWLLGKYIASMTDQQNY